MKARTKEMGYIHEKKVWERMSRKRAIALGWKIVKTRWIDINKGDWENPNFRSRFVAKEFNDGVAEGLFASTPPLEALRFLISEAATVDVGTQARTSWGATCGTGEGEKGLMINDVARAFFEAPVKRNKCVELPPEEGARPDEVGRLKQSLYGTRDASANFQEEVRLVLTRAGFVQVKYNPSLYYHPGRHIRTLVHGDDFPPWAPAEK